MALFNRVLVIVLVLVLALNSGLTYVLEDGDGPPKSLNWPEEYHFKGEQMNIQAGIVEPIEIWYIAASNRSRIDYYGGTVRHYYEALPDYGYGTEYIINPMTNEEVTNKFVCRETLFVDELNFLPVVKNFTFAGQKVYNKKLVQVWKHLTEDDKQKVETTLYAYENDDGIDVPVYHEERKHNLWTGVVEDHTIKRYFAYSKPEEEALDYSLEEACNETSPIYVDSNEPYSSYDINNAFNSYATRHSKKYEGDEHELRKKIFEDNWRHVIEHNQKNLGYKLTLNKFSDRTADELAHLRAARPSSEHVGTVPFPHTQEEVAQLVQEIPDSYDMRIEGFISAVKNQANCGSCWAFSAVAAVEGALARVNGGRDFDLSEQSLVDCAWGFDTFGCQGGIVDGVYKYVLKHGIPSEMDYGLYLNKEGYCKLENMTHLYSIRGFAAVPPLSVDAMKVALYKYGPVTVTINAKEDVFAYSSGIYYNPTCNKGRINHAVTVVGYGVRDGALYWIVKNSWGEDWGQDGYILFSATGNNCHILENAVYPVV